MDHWFQPGNKESTGRPKGAPNKRSTELENRLRNRGDVDPADFLSSIVTSETEATEFKIAAANYLLLYLYAKRGAIPPPKYVELEIDVNEFTHVSDAENFLAKIALLVARGQLDIQSAQELSGLVKTWIDSQYQREELAYKLSPPETLDTTIRITGGLPQLPGTSIVMPVLDGKPVTNGHALAAPTDAVPAIEAAHKAQDPEPPPQDPEP